MPANASNTILTVDGTQTINTGTETAIVFGGTAIENGTVDFLTGAPTDGVIIPSGVTYVRFQIRIGLTANGGAGFIYSAIKEDPSGTPVYRFVDFYPVNQAGTGFVFESCVTRPIAVSTNDEFKAYIYHTQGVTRTVRSDMQWWVIDATGDLA